MMVTRGEKLERDFKSKLLEHIRGMLGNDGYAWSFDPNEIQGFPDIVILYKKKWAALECKRSSAAEYRPNQEYYLEHLDSLSFARVIHPANQEEVLDELRQALRLR